MSSRTLLVFVMIGTLFISSMAAGPSDRQTGMSQSYGPGFASPSLPPQPLAHPGMPSTRQSSAYNPYYTQGTVIQQPVPMPEISHTLRPQEAPASVQTTAHVPLLSAVMGSVLVIENAHDEYAQLILDVEDIQGDTATKTGEQLIFRINPETINIDKSGDKIAFDQLRIKDRIDVWYEITSEAERAPVFITVLKDMSS